MFSLELGLINEICSSYDARSNKSRRSRLVIRNHRRVGIVPYVWNIETYALKLDTVFIFLYIFLNFRGFYDSLDPQLKKVESRRIDYAEKSKFFKQLTKRLANELSSTEFSADVSFYARFIVD